MDERDRAQFWKFTAIGILVVAATAVITGLVVANRTASDTSAVAQAPSSPSPTRPAATTGAPAATPVAPAATPVAPPSGATQAPRHTGAPPQEVVSACNQQAATQAGSAPREGKDKVWDVGKDAGV